MLACVLEPTPLSSLRLQFLMSAVRYNDNVEGLLPVTVQNSLETAASFLSAKTHRDKFANAACHASQQVQHLQTTHLIVDRCHLPHFALVAVP